MKRNFRVANLIGPELDQAVALALGYIQSSGPWWHHKDDPARMLNIEAFHPSSDNSGHDIIEESWIGLERPSRGQVPPQWRALTDFKGDRKYNPMNNVVDAWGPTALIAAMRCKVASIYGESVELNVKRPKASEPSGLSHA